MQIVPRPVQRECFRSDRLQVRARADSGLSEGFAEFSSVCGEERTLRIVREFKCVRSLHEIAVVLAEHFDLAGLFLDQLDLIPVLDRT